MTRTVLVCLLCAGSAWAERPVESWRDTLADDALQGTSTEALDQMSKKMGIATFGKVMKSVPSDDLATALGAAAGGDGAAAKQALIKGILKSLAALGAEAAVGTSAAAVAPLIASVGAAFVVGMIYDELVSDDQAETALRMRELDLRLKQAKTGAERNLLKLDRDLLGTQLLLLSADATSAHLEAKALLGDYAQGKLTREAYEQAMTSLGARQAALVKGYAEVRSKLAKLQPTNQEAKLAELKERHRQLKALVDASGGHDEAAYVEMKAVYQEYMSLKRSLEKR